MSKRLDKLEAERAKWRGEMASAMRRHVAELTEENARAGGRAGVGRSVGANYDVLDLESNDLAETGRAVEWLDL